MKTTMSFLLVVLMAVVFSGCSESSSDQATQAPAAETRKVSETKGLAVSATQPAQVEPNFTIETFDTQLKGKPFALESLVFLPADYEASAKAGKRWPVILFLHGAGERGKKAVELKTKHLPTVLADKPDFPAIVVSPQCPADAWWGGEMLDRVDEMLGQMMERYSVDTDRVYLTGLSMGGYGTWNMLQLHPQRYAAFVVVCGAMGKGSIENAVHIPGWAFHGTEDQLVKIGGGLAAAEAFRKAGGTIDFTKLQGVGHDAWVAAYETDPAAFEWMLKKRRGKSGDTVQLDDETKQFFNTWRACEEYRREARQQPWMLREGDTKLTLTRKNDTSMPIIETLHWSVPAGWKITPNVFRVSTKPGDTAKMDFVVTFSGQKKDLAEFPACTSVLESNGIVVRKFSNPLRMDDVAFFAKARQVHTVPSLSEAPTIDGKSEAVWEKVASLTPLQLSNAQGPVPFATDARLAYDKTNLYVLVRAEEPNPEKLTRQMKERDDSVYRDDCFSLLLQPPAMAKEGKYYHILINPNGTVMDSIVHERSWNPPYEIKAIVNSSDWTVEYAIPLKALGVEGSLKGQRWGFMFDRSRKQAKPDQQFGQWTPMFGWSHQPTRFGELVFE